MIAAAVLLSATKWADIANVINSKLNGEVTVRLDSYERRTLKNAATILVQLSRVLPDKKAENCTEGATALSVVIGVIEYSANCAVEWNTTLLWARLKASPGQKRLRWLSGMKI